MKYDDWRARQKDDEVEAKLNAGLPLNDNGLLAAIEKIAAERAKQAAQRPSGDGILGVAQSILFWLILGGCGAWFLGNWAVDHGFFFVGV